MVGNKVSEHTDSLLIYVAYFWKRDLPEVRSIWELQIHLLWPLLQASMQTGNQSDGGPFLEAFCILAQQHFQKVGLAQHGRHCLSLGSFSAFPAFPICPCLHLRTSGIITRSTPFLLFLPSPSLSVTDYLFACSNFYSPFLSCPPCTMPPFVLAPGPLLILPVVLLLVPFPLPPLFLSYFLCPLFLSSLLNLPTPGLLIHSRNLFIW